MDQDFVIEDEENENRRDDRLESDFLRSADRDNQEYDLRRRMAEATFQQSNEAFSTRQKARDEQAAVTSRENEAYAGLTFRDSAVSSTATNALEGVGAAVGEALEEAIEDDEAE